MAVSKSKARKMLHEGQAHGRLLTEKQRGYFGARSHMSPGDGTGMDASRVPSVQAKDILTDVRASKRTG